MFTIKCFCVKRTFFLILSRHCDVTVHGRYQTGQNVYVANFVNSLKGILIKNQTYNRHLVYLCEIINVVNTELMPFYFVKMGEAFVVRTMSTILKNISMFFIYMITNEYGCAKRIHFLSRFYLCRGMALGHSKLRETCSWCLLLQFIEEFSCLQVLYSLCT